MSVWACEDAGCEAGAASDGTDDETAAGACEEVLDAGFDAVQMARALLNEPGFVNRMAREDRARCNCGHSNYCIGRMYTIEMACHKHLNEELPPCLQKEIEKLEKQ